MTYIALITFIFITFTIGFYLLFARQNAIDSLLGFINLFSTSFLISYLLELRFSISFSGSLIVVLGFLFFIVILVYSLVRFEAYKTNGNSNIEG